MSTNEFNYVNCLDEFCRRKGICEPIYNKLTDLKDEEKEKFNFKFSVKLDYDRHTFYSFGKGVQEYDARKYAAKHCILKLFFHLFNQDSTLLPKDFGLKSEDIQKHNQTLTDRLRIDFHNFNPHHFYSTAEQATTSNSSNRNYSNGRNSRNYSNGRNSRNHSNGQNSRNYSNHKNSTNNQRSNQNRNEQNSNQLESDNEIINPFKGDNFKRQSNELRVESPVFRYDDEINEDESFDDSSCTSSDNESFESDFSNDFDFSPFKEFRKVNDYSKSEDEDYSDLGQDNNQLNQDEKQVNRDENQDENELNQHENQDENQDETELNQDENELNQEENELNQEEVKNESELDKDEDYSDLGQDNNQLNQDENELDQYENELNQDEDQDQVKIKNEQTNEKETEKIKEAIKYLIDNNDKVQIIFKKEGQFNFKDLMDNFVNLLPKLKIHYTQLDDQNQIYISKLYYEDSCCLNTTFYSNSIENCARKMYFLLKLQYSNI